VLFTLASSWYGLVLTPQMQVGRLYGTNTLPSGMTYPLPRSGQAHEGREVYRANGCAHCHSQQTVQSAIACDLILTQAGTNQSALQTALSRLKPGLTPSQASELLSTLPKTLLTGVNKDTAKAADKALKAAGAKSEVWIVPQGPDIARGWGKRRSVAEDFLHDYPVMLGSQRIGPDLANIGTRKPDPNWHLLHLYAPELMVKDSVMPPYRFLFETRDIRVPSPDALPLSGKWAPPQGKEVVPKREAKALVEYLMSLRAEMPLYVSPLTVPASQAPETNAPAAPTGTPATNSSAASTK
jgi:ribosomal protein L7/L12